MWQLLQPGIPLTPFKSEPWQSVHEKLVPRSSPRGAADQECDVVSTADEELYGI